MSVINTTGVAVWERLWVPGFSWQAHTPEEIISGAADTEEEAWAKARAAAKTLGIEPKGQG